MKALLQPLQQLAEMDKICSSIKSKKGVLQITGCVESQKAHLMYGLSGLFPCHLILAEDEHRAREIWEDYSFYDESVLYYPARDLLFFQADIHGNLLLRQRMQVIKALLTRDSVSVVTTIDGCMDARSDLETIRRSLLHFRTGEEADMESLVKSLVCLGYERVGQVEMPGHFCVRGGILDIYCLTEENPWRVEFFGDEIDSIRSFDSTSQRSLENLEEITVYPAVEQVEGKGMVSFLDYFPVEKTLVFLDEPNRLSETALEVEEEFYQSCKNREEKGNPTMSRDWMCSYLTLCVKLNHCHCAALSTLPMQRGDWKITGRFDLTVKSISSYHGSFDILVKDLISYKRQGYRIILLCGSRTRAARLAGDLQEEGLPAFTTDDSERVLQNGEIMVIYGHARKGFEYPGIRFAVITESDIFGQEQVRKRRKKDYSGERIQDFSDLTVGDYVVHERHGLGIYRGIEKVEVDHLVKDYIRIEYRDGGSLYIPPTQLDALLKYSVAEGARAPQLNSLGSPEWRKTRSKVQKEVRDIAKELVDLYAARQNKPGFVYGPDTVWQREFEELFPFEETADQLSAIEDTKRDMEGPGIMDRLICGDVGYGKTEVALRAAFKAVQENRQVVYLVPTTILAQQHYNTFVQRMKNFPVRVDLLCRFRTPAQQRQTVEDIKKGLVDVVIGTHRVLSKDVVFKNLGLLIIDEEQRFGVKHKEKIKKLRQDVDVLTLTATPIPRTLHMSLIGIRDMSVLEEPPLDRVPIQTYVMEYDEETVREAIRRELRREGQVYYVYNRVNDIVEVTRRVEELVPEARVGFAHGRMSERELERVMYNFINGDLDVLVTTTIIETGLDISNVNTMIVHDSDRYGLAQLYQLRGRIGRSNRTAYAFLMYKKDKTLGETAEKRLGAIREYTDLGSGIKIAMRDLELRGAGNLLGAEQHGHMDAVGYDLYCKMLSEAVKEARGIPVMEDFDTTIDLSMNAYIPDSYISNEVQKLDIYRRIAAISGQDDYDDMLEELIDRFGELPRSVMNLLSVARLKAFAHQAYVTEIKQMGKEVRITLFERAHIDPSGIPALMRRYRRGLTFKADKEPRFFLTPEGNLMDVLTDFVRQLEKLVEEQDPQAPAVKKKL